jgi:sulfite reductase alpha subunit-like flavoprotein
MEHSKEIREWINAFNATIYLSGINRLPDGVRRVLAEVIEYNDVHLIIEHLSNI